MQTALILITFGPRLHRLILESHPVSAKCAETAGDLHCEPMKPKPTLPSKGRGKGGATTFKILTAKDGPAPWQHHGNGCPRLREVRSLGIPAAGVRRFSESATQLSVVH